AGAIVAATCSTSFANGTSPGVPEGAVAGSQHDWTGIYLGLNAGYQWGNADLDVTHRPSQAAFGANPYSVNHDPDGFLGGVQAGYNWQSDMFVFGVEADIQFMNADSSRTTTPLILFGGAPQAGSFAISRSELNALGTLRARVGAAMDRNLFYLTGGLAFGQVEDFSRAQYGGGVGNAFNYIATTDSWRTGWTIGAGFERAIDDNWTVKAEYLHYDLGEHSVTGLPVAPNPPFNTNNIWDVSGDIARIGLNYKFRTY
ncbi:MAG: outer membrane beta-barrel protein, partial [Fimbriimonadaceae bacterium]|nr:outer membrane beta-barrel protein [Alphaproteobacteria bacterium]